MFGFECLGFPNGPSELILFSKNQRNDFLCAKGVVILDGAVHLLIVPSNQGQTFLVELIHISCCIVSHLFVNYDTFLVVLH
jgi:hypothetical protein